jgi:hypothetical protein
MPIYTKIPRIDEIGNSQAMPVRMIEIVVLATAKIHKNHGCDCEPEHQGH